MNNVLFVNATIFLNLFLVSAMLRVPYVDDGRNHFLTCWNKTYVSLYTQTLQ